jgi:hypothetical protein
MSGRTKFAQANTKDPYEASYLEDSDDEDSDDDHDQQGNPAFDISILPILDNFRFDHADDEYDSQEEDEKEIADELDQIMALIEEKKRNLPGAGSNVQGNGQLQGSKRPKMDQGGFAVPAAPRLPRPEPGECG